MHSPYAIIEVLQRLVFVVEIEDSGVTEIMRKGLQTDSEGWEEKGDESGGRENLVSRNEKELTEVLFSIDVI